MKALLKVFLWLFGLAVLAVIAAVVAIPMFFDPNDYKDQIVAMVEKATGRKFTLEGELGLSVFPKLGIDINGVTLGNAPGFGDTPFLKSERAQVRVALIPLLKKQVEMDKVILHGASIYLAKDKSGKTNWDDLAGPKKETLPKQDGGAGLALASLAFGGLDIQNASLVWDDRSKGQRYALSGLTVETGALEMNEPVDLNVSFVLDAAKEGISGMVGLQGTVAYDLDNQRYQLSPFKLDTDLRGARLPGGAARMKIRSDIDADLKAATTKLSKLTVEGLGLLINGEIQARKIFDPIPLVDGQVMVSAMDSHALVEAMGQDPQKLPLQSFTVQTQLSSTETEIRVQGFNATALLQGGELPTEGPVAVEVKTDALVNTKAQTLAIDSFSLRGLGLELQAQAKGEKILDAPEIRAGFKLAPFNLRGLLVQLGQKAPETADPEVLKNVSLSSQLLAGTGGVTLQNMEMQLDNTAIKGEVSIANFAQPAYGFGLTVDAIDLDRYLPPQPAGAAPATPEAAAGAAAGMPVDKLRALNIKGNLAIGSLTMQKAKLSNVKLAINAKNGKIDIAPAAAELYRGAYSGNVSLDATGNLPRIAIDSSLKGIQAAPLMLDFTGKEPKIDGRTNADLKLTATGTGADAFKQTLNGSARLVFTDGALKGVNIAQIIREVEARISGTTLPPSAEAVQTDFSELSGTFNFNQGVMNNQDLAMKSPLLRLDGAGTANLVNKQVNYAVTTTLVGTLKGQGGEELAELKGIPIPIKVSGTYDDLKFAPDIEAIVKSRLDEELNKQKEKITKEVEEKIQEQLGGKVQEQVGDKVQEQAGDKLKDQVGDKLQEGLKGILKF